MIRTVLVCVMVSGVISWLTARVMIKLCFKVLDKCLDDTVEAIKDIMCMDKDSSDYKQTGKQLQNTTPAYPKKGSRKPPVM